MLIGNCKNGISKYSYLKSLELKTECKIANCFCFVPLKTLNSQSNTHQLVGWLHSLHYIVIIKHPTSLKTSASYATAGKLLTNKLGLLMSPVRRNMGRTHGQINLKVGKNALPGRQRRTGTLCRTENVHAKAEYTPERTSISRMCRND